MSTAARHKIEPRLHHEIVDSLDLKSAPRWPGGHRVVAINVRGVFFWEGILKFVYANQGIGRFTKLGMPFPEFTATSVAVLEIVGGMLLILGLGTRLVAIPFIIEMLVAILTTKISMYLGTSPLPLPPVPPQTGFWAVLHEIRSEYAQLLTVLFLMMPAPAAIHSMPG